MLAKVLIWQQRNCKIIKFEPAHCVQQPACIKLQALDEAKLQLTMGIVIQNLHASGVSSVADLTGSKIQA